MARILLVDDAMFMRAMLKKTLVDGGHEIVGEADNGLKALDLYGQLRPDLVMLDITMPEMDGLATLHELLILDPGARVVMCTALGQQDKVREALTQGAREYVIKPFTPVKLLDAVTRSLA